MMTVAELYYSVSHLGFEKSLEENGIGFYEALNRALLELNALRPAQKVYQLNHRPLENMLGDKTYKPVVISGEERTFEADSAKAYYFEADGIGTAFIECYENSEWKPIANIDLSSKGNFVAYKGFVKKDGNFTDLPIRIKFFGDYTYSVKNVCLYADLFSNKEEDIPVFEPYVRYDIEALTDDFLSLARPPIRGINRRQIPTDDYDVENRRVILLSRNCPRGVYEVIYNRRPTPLIDSGEAENDVTPIDLDDDVVALAPMLIGLYLWADDEPELAQYYRSLYDQGASRIAYLSKSNHTPCKMRSINGW